MSKRLIKLRFSTIDGFAESRTFKTLDGAKKYARRRVGTAFDVSGLGYAIDAYGVGKLEIREGTTFKELLGADAWS